MKKLLLLLIGSFLVTSAYAEVLTPEQALSRATNSNASRHIKGANYLSPRLVKTVNAESQPAVYLFDRGSNAGYMVLSADDATDAILGYCDEGSIDVNNLPSDLSYWLDCYADEIDFARKNPQLKQQARAKYKTFPVMCQTLWDQEAPYNNKCPEYKSGSRSVTGCMATAIGQILKYFNYPKQGTGTYSYEWTNKYTKETTTLSYDFDANTFDWDNMLNEYENTEATDEQKDAVAELMKALGILLNMDYGQSSGAGTNAFMSVYSYMKVDKSICFAERDYYTAADWEKLIYEALSVGPIMYGGQSQQGGHAFVCDGYNDGYFHINWGWGGYCNGYFLLSALTYENKNITTADGYNRSQHAMLYVQPEKEGSVATYQMVSDSYQIQEATTEIGDKLTTTSRLINRSSVPMAVQLLTKITDENGNAVYATGYSDPELKVGYGYSNFTTTIPESLADGTYTLTPAYAVDGVYYDALVKVSGTQSYTMVVKDGVCTLSAGDSASITGSDLQINTPIYLNSDFDSNATLTNATDYEYSGFVAMALYDLTNKETLTDYISEIVPVTVPANSSIDLNYVGSFSTLPESVSSDSYGVQLVELTYDSKLKAYSYSKTLTDPVTVDKGISNTAATASLSASNLVAQDSEAVDPNNVHFSFDVTNSSGYFSGTITAYIFLPSGGTSVAMLKLSDVFINEGETVTVNVDGELSELEPGNSYYYMVVVDRTFISSERCSFTIAQNTSVNSSVTDIDADAQPISVEYYTLQGVRVSGETLSPGLYIKVEKLVDGSTRTTRIAQRQ
jgi:hypothetical protein